MKKVFANKNFILLFVGDLVSSIGNSIYNFAIGLYIFEITESPIQFSLYMAVGLIITLVLTPFCGVLADRFNKVRTIYITDLIRGIVIAAAGIIIFQGLTQSNTMIVLYTCTIILSISSSLFQPSVDSLQVEVVDPDDLQSANATLSMTTSIQMIIGLTIGGILYDSLGINWIFIINGLTFIISGFSEMFINHPFIKKEDKLTLKSGFIDFKIGIKYLVSKKGLMSLMIAALFLNFAFIPLFATGFPYLFKVLLERSAVEYSFVQVAISVGTLIGAITIANLAGKLNLMKSQYLGLSLMTIIFIGIALLFNMILAGSIGFKLFYILIISLMLIEGIINMYLNVPLSTAIAKSIDQEYRGRAFSVISTMSMCAVPIAFLLGGILIESSSLQALMVFSISVLLIIIFVFMTNKNIRQYLRNSDNV